MADALCGPSNPLQQFKQQTQFDRTLQQDRLTSRHTPIQGFRSHDPNTGLLDPEFEAFQAGVPLPELPQLHQRPVDFSGGSQIPSWASDFQRMQISPSPGLQHQNVMRTGPASANWSQGFRDHIAQNAPRAQTSHSPQAFQHMARYGMNGFQSQFAQPSFVPSAQSKGKESAVEQFDEAAFDRAFDQAREDLLAIDTMDVETPAYQAGASTADFETDQEFARESAAIGTAGTQDALEELSVEQAKILEELIEPLEDEPILQDTMVEEQTEEAEQVQRNDDDALAATARELLEKVEHNKSDKFKNSQFLNLMRKLRDREMKVEGDQMVETAAASTATTETQGLDTITIEGDAVTREHLQGSHLFQNINVNGNAQATLGNTTQNLFPLGETHVDTRPPDYNIPPDEQDFDMGRIDPKDGQAVVDYLNQQGADPDDIGTSDFHLPEGIFYGDLRPRKRAAAAPDVDWKRWDLRANSVWHSEHRRDPQRVSHG